MRRVSASARIKTGMNSQPAITKSAVQITTSGRVAAICETMKHASRMRNGVLDTICTTLVPFDVSGATVWSV